VDIWQAIILGIVEGATEYLPISSTFHLIWTAKILGISQTDFQKAFEVIIQSGAILAVVWLYFPRWRQLENLFPLVLVSFLPTAIIGLSLYKVIKSIFFENIALQLGVFAAVGFLFIVFEQILKPKLSKNAESITIKEAIFVGLAQALAIIPGVSRAGAVILGLMFLRVKREQAAQYSFLLAVPTLLAASALDLIKSAPYLASRPDDFGLLVVGFVAAFGSAYLVVKWFVVFLQKHSLVGFGFYRLLLALVLITIFSSTIF
jgi:undecaprenyl-diphosphatase